VTGLVLSYHANIPAGPSVTLVAGLIYVVSIVAGPAGGLIWRAFLRRHLEA